ncbi:MAG: NfeD family protein [Clostridiales bacterium]|nr:NfeD family protein [Clostridiales bacterium]
MIWVWLAVFVVLAIAEGLTYNLVCIWFCLGSLAAIAAAAGGMPVWAQIICCVLVGIITLCTLRPYMKKKITPKITKSGAQRLLGASATVIEEVDATKGAVKANGAEWNARSTGEIIEKGKQCTVMKMDGNKLIVSTNEPKNNKEEE